jgi:hypothetical protein
MELTGWQPDPFEDGDPSEVEQEEPEDSELDAIFQAWEEDRI